MTDSKKSSLGSIYLGLLFHSHQPVGNFPWVFQQVYEQSYLPMLEALERHPTVRLALHYTGSLLDWLEEAHPQFIQRVAALAQRNQVEIVSGGYYEPILPMIPDRDKIAQIHRLSERIERDFGVKPTGMWLAERVGQPLHVPLRMLGLNGPSSTIFISRMLAWMIAISMVTMPLRIRAASSKSMQPVKCFAIRSLGDQCLRLLQLFVLSLHLRVIVLL